MSSLSSRSSSCSSLVSASTSSTLSLSRTQSRYDPHNLESRAIKILTFLSNNPSDTTQISKLISPNIKVEHGDDAPVYSLDKYLARFSTLSQRHPGFCLAILEACVDEVQRKVWVSSEITGLPGGMVKESIDMLTFDEHGVLVSSVDEQKVRRRL